MRCLILYAALFGAVAGLKAPLAGELLQNESTVAQLEITTDISSTNSEPSAQTTSSTQTNSIEEIVSELPVSSPPILEEIDLPNLPNRRVVTYDQRQEGKYNVRADLENFMIVLVPPRPGQGVGLLDMFALSSLFRSAAPKRKFVDPKSAYIKNHNSWGDKSSDQHTRGPYGPGEFIKGRTPYHVDITSLNEEKPQPRLNPDRQVDVLPPPYPLAYPHLMKPYHLEAESSLLPPSEISLQHNSESLPSQSSGYNRLARYIRGNDFLGSNRVTTSNKLETQPLSFRSQQLPFYRSDLSMGAAQLYPPLDVPHYNYHQIARNIGTKFSSARSAENFDSKQSLDTDLPYSEIIIPPAHLPLEDDLELALNDESLLEGEAKALLSDGIERCAPGKRRDSYGVCREIEGY